MIIIKSPEEIAIMRRAGQIVAECHQVLQDMVKPGVTTLELDEVAEEYIRQQGALPSFKGHQGFPASICVAINDVVCHGIPGLTKLQTGDVITIDIGALYQGFHGDSAWTYAVGDVSKDVRQLIKVGLECLFLGIEEARPGKRIGAIGHAIQTYAEEHGYGVVRMFCGHGVGRKLWEDPLIPHVGEPDIGAEIKEGMVFAIEPMITMGDWATEIADDGTARTMDGSLCVQYEHTIAITKDGPRILTKL